MKKFIKKKLLVLTASLAMAFSLCAIPVQAVDNSNVANVSSREELIEAFSNEAVTEINITQNIDLADAVWKGITIGVGRNLTVNGNGYTILNMTVLEGALLPSGSGIAGDGGSCDYYAGWIANNKGTLTINDLKFANAKVDVDPVTTGSKSTGSSILAVVVANNTGTLVYNDVDVNNSIIRGYTKVGALHGFSQQSGSFTANHCSVTNTTVELEADGTDPEACFGGFVAGYNGNNKIKTNGIKLENNKKVINENVDWEVTAEVTSSGLEYYSKYNSQWGMISDTYTNDSNGMSEVLFNTVVGGYGYESLEDAKLATKVTNVVLDNAASIEVGKKLTLNAVTTPTETAEEISWSSSNPNIATVENGVVTAIATGKTTITVTAGSKTAECIISVYKIENPTPPSVDTQKPVEKPQAGLNDEKAPEILNDTLNDIISKGTDSVYTDEKTVQNINDAIASGETITVNPTVEEINTANPQASEDIKAIEKELKQITQENNSVTEVAMYLDLSVLVKTPTSDLGNITVLPKPLTFTVVLPNDVAENAKDKDVYVLRMHEGKVDKIKAALTDNVITFETDRFSTYAVVFEEKTVTPAPTPEGPIHEVTFVDMNGAVLKIESVKDGEKATAPAAPTIEGYTFIKWDTDFSKVTKNLVVTAVYEKLPVEEVVKPDDKGENKTENTDNPSTGDKTNASLYSAFALLGLVSAALVVVEKKRRSLSR